ETLAAPIGTPVLLVREGAVVPMLASDVETLIATEAPSIVDLEDRATDRRVRVVPGADGEIVLEEGATIRLRSRDAESAEIEIDPADSGIDRWILIVDTTGADVEVAGRVAVPAASRAEVEAYCDGCWLDDVAARQVVVGVRGRATVLVRDAP
ncbi:MAG: hypothetical protein IT379_17180, partial [Deltaproteobacteria bacterium]|nr:hypothetical protein [Deltaproteobacteria bacterium]